MGLRGSALSAIAHGTTDTVLPVVHGYALAELYPTAELHIIEGMCHELQPHYVEQLSEKLPFYSFRLVVTPGLTSWGQVKCGYSGSEEETLERLQYEFFHLRHQSFGFDFRVLLRTLRSVVGTQNPGR